MDNNKTSVSNEKFIRRVIAVSLALVLAVVNLSLIVFSHLDEIKHYYVRQYTAQKNYDRALEINDTISDSDMRLEGKYSVALSLYNDCSYTDAVELFTELGDYSDSDSYSLKGSYAIAEKLYQDKQYDEALSAFAALGDYSDSKERQLEIRYEVADNTHNDGDYSEAVLRFLALGDYKDCADRAFQSALALTGDEAVAEEMLYSGGLTGDELTASLLTAERRSIFPKKMIDAGAKHTVLLHTDGTVSACGDNSYGQCDVGEWTDIVEIAAGAYHTVGLRSDGTVVAAGKNTHEQCNVSTWSDIISIAAGDSDTYALTSKGKIKSSGYHDYKNLLRASDVSNIYAGSYAAVAELSSGGYLPSHKTYSLTAEREIVSVGLNTGYIIALQADGKCITSIEAAAKWENIAHIDAGSTAILAVDSQGRAKAHFFRKTDAADLSSVEDACQCATGPEHFVFLLADGTVVAFGDNSSGQCDVSALGSAV